MIADYLIGAVIIGGAAGLALNAWDGHQARKAKLEALPADFQFPGCDAVRAQGLDPLRRGEPGYGKHMDGDGDGIACEPYP